MDGRRGTQARSRSAGCRWTLACGILVLSAIGISVAALIISLEARQQNTSLAAQVGTVISSAIVEEYSSGFNGTASSVSCLDEQNVADTVVCICKDYQCPDNTHCANATSNRLRTYCQLCEKDDISC